MAFPLFFLVFLFFFLFFSFFPLSVLPPFFLPSPPPFFKGSHYVMLAGFELMIPLPWSSNWLGLQTGSKKWYMIN